jgi:hypothetical protein
MIIDFEFIKSEYPITNFEEFIKIFGLPHFEKRVKIYDKNFNLDYYNKLYNFNFIDYEIAYFDWMIKRKQNYKGYQKIENDIKYYSTFDQDYIVINKLFNKCFGGTFIDFFSLNTIVLEESFNWSGLIINNNNNRKVKCIEFNNNLKEILINNSILKNIHVINIPFDIIKNFDFNGEYTIYCIIIPYTNDNIDSIKEFMNDKGYQLYYECLTEFVYILPELLEKKVVNSFDFFDTIVHRHYVDDSTILKVVNGPMFYNRKMAEQNSTSLQNIYEIMHPTDSELSKKLFNIEFNLELSNLFLNNSNYIKIKDTDILISDTYYSKEELQIIFNKFEIKNDFYCSKDGKKAGYIYKDLAEKYIIVCHIGDNFLSDGKMALLNNLNIITNYFGNLTEFEEQLRKLNLFNISFLLRKTRLSITFDISLEMLVIAQLTYIINLIIYVIIIKEYSGYDNYLLTTRDCCILEKFFETFAIKENQSYYFNEKYNSKFNFTRLYTSRKAYKKNSYTYKKYFKSITNYSKNLLIDMNGSGNSVLNYLDTNNIDNVDALYIFKVGDNKVKYITNKEKLYDVLEVVNYDYNGKCIDYCGGPVYEKVEFPVDNILLIHAYINSALENSKSYKNEIINDITYVFYERVQ